MKQKLKIVIIASALLVSGAVFSCGKTEKLSLKSGVEYNSEEQTDRPEAAEPARDSAPDDVQISVEDISSGEQKPSEILVYVCGAVNAPDVYELEPDSRIIDAVKKAGGFMSEAAEDYHNLAAPLSDGMKIYVPTIQEVEEGYSEIPEPGQISDGQTEYSFGDSKNGKVNINTADAAELKTLNGIGDKRAQDIIDYRESHGRFKKIDDIMLVPGIKNGIFSKICDDIEV